MDAKTNLYIDPSLQRYWDNYDSLVQELLADAGPGVHADEVFNQLVKERHPTTRVILDRLGVPPTGAEIYAASVFGFKNSFLYSQLIVTWTNAVLEKAQIDSVKEYGARLEVIANEIKAHLAIQRFLAKDKSLELVIRENNQVLQQAINIYENIKAETIDKANKTNDKEALAKALEQFTEATDLLTSKSVRAYVQAKNLPIRQNMMRNINATIPGGAKLTSTEIGIVDDVLHDITNEALLKLAEKQWQRENDPEAQKALEKKKEMIRNRVLGTSETGDFLPAQVATVDEQVNRMAPTLDQLVAHGVMKKGASDIQGMVLAKCMAAKIKENFQSRKESMPPADQGLCKLFCDDMGRCETSEGFEKFVRNNGQHDLEALSKLMPVLGVGLEEANLADLERKEAEQAIRKLAEDLHGKDQNIFKAGQEEVDALDNLDIKYIPDADPAKNQANLAGISNFFYNRIDEMGISAKGVAQLQQAMFANAGYETRQAAKAADLQVSKLMGQFLRGKLDNEQLLKSVQEHQKLEMPAEMKYEFKSLRATYENELKLLKHRKESGDLSDDDYNNKMRELDARYPNVQYSAPQYMHLALLRELHRRVDYAINGVNDPEIKDETKRTQHKEDLAKLSSVYQQAIANFMSVNKPQPANALSAPSPGPGCAGLLADMLSCEPVLQSRSALLTAMSKLGLPRPEPSSRKDRENPSGLPKPSPFAGG